MAAARTLDLVVPGDWRTPTGGYRYDRRIAEALGERGWTVRHHAVPGSWPAPAEADRQAAGRVLAALPDGACVLADGLFFGAAPALARSHAQRLRWIALVHHPLHLETGIDAARREALRASERDALATVRAVVVTSAATVRDVVALGVPPGCIHIVEPGTDPAAAAVGGARRLLCVASLTPRKGHAVLLQALAAGAAPGWVLHAVGSAERDAACARALHEACTALGLDDRVRWHGEVDEAALRGHYAAADLFVQPSFHEGYGMAVAEALAHGLPVVASRAGALADTLPTGAGLLVPPGDAAALAEALDRLAGDAALRARCAAAARRAGARLPGWPDAAARLARVVEAVAADEGPP